MFYINEKLGIAVNLVACRHIKKSSPQHMLREDGSIGPEWRINCHSDVDYDVIKFDSEKERDDEFAAILSFLSIMNRKEATAQIVP